MPHRFAKSYRDHEMVAWSDVPWLWYAYGIAAIIGLVAGAAWIGWELLRAHVF
jgi:hypothetical protein